MIVKSKRRIAIFTGKRGGAGAMSQIIRLFDSSDGWDCTVITSDMHVSNKFGNTNTEVEEFAERVVKIEIPDYGSELFDRATALGAIYLGMVSYFANNKTDLLLLLGDRGETLIASNAAIQMSVPVAHIQAGDISGGLDNIHRHSITKLAHLHFAQTASQAKRVLDLGEEEFRVHNVGAPYIDNVLSSAIPSIDEVVVELDLPQEEFCILLHHSDTYNISGAGEEICLIISELKRIDIHTIVVHPCSDPGYDTIVREIEKLTNLAAFSIFKSIPFQSFLSLLANAKFLIGNSSAGILEAPYFNLPFINVGERQKLREMDDNVLSVGSDRESIAAAIEAVMTGAFSPNTAENRRFGDGKASDRIFRIIDGQVYDDGFFQKRITY